MLSDQDIAAAEVRPKLYKLADERSLHVAVSPTGVKSFRWKYRYQGREKLLTVGRFPHISVAEARRRAAHARQQLADGIDPAHRQIAESIVSLSDLPLLPLPEDGARVVYFLRTVTGHIKIGTTASLDHRMSAMRTAHAEPVVLLAAVRGGHSHEATLHRIFARDRDHGEWFSPSPELLTFVAQVSETGEWPC